MLITSRANERVKTVKALKDRRERDATGTFFAEGHRVLRAGIETGATIDQIVAAPDRLDGDEAQLLDEFVASHVPVLEVSPEVYDSLSYREGAESIGAVIRQRWEELTDQTRGKRCWVALHDIQHPGNLGTVIRTCDAVGGDGVILSGRTTDPYHPVAVRGSLGSIFSQRIVRATSSGFARWVKQAGVTVVGTSPHGDRDYREADYSRPVVLLMGSERIGISEGQIALCDAVVRIPMLGYVESLNLSIASALVLYEVMRQQEAAART
jgi:RNA methyltransferase, TrmH family